MLIQMVLSSRKARESYLRRIISIEESVIKEEMDECIRDFVDGLPGDYRIVIFIHDLQGLKNREIAEILDCTLEMVKIRLKRARNKLRTVLASNCDFYRDKNDALCCNSTDNHFPDNDKQ